MYCKYCGKAVDLTTMQCVSCGREVGPLSGGTGFWDLLDPPADRIPVQATEPVSAAETKTESKNEAETEDKTALVQAQAEAEAARKALLDRQKLDVDARLVLGRRAQRARLVAIISSVLFVLALVGVILLWIHAGSLESELSALQGETGEQNPAPSGEDGLIPSFPHSPNERTGQPGPARPKLRGGPAAKLRKRPAAEL